MRISHRFTRPGSDPFAYFTMVERELPIQNLDGSIASNSKRLEPVLTPTGWSHNACVVVAQKYLRKTGVPLESVRVEEPGVPAWAQRSVPVEGTSFRGETDIREAIHRMAGAWTYWGFVSKTFLDEEEGRAFYDEAIFTLMSQMWSPNSPQWFNTGLHWAYGIEGPAQGHYYVDPNTDEVIASKSAYMRPQPHACQPAWAMVSTPEGLVPIGDIVREHRIGLTIFDREGTTKVVAVSANGTKKVHRVHLRSGRYIDVTADHEVLVSQHGKDKEGAFLRADEIEEGMRLHLPMRSERIREEDPENRMASEAALAGWLLTDGFVGQYGEGTNRSLTVEFETVYDEEFAWVKKHLEEVFPEVVFNQINEHIDNPNLTYRRLRAYGERFREFVTRWGLLDRGENAKVPPFLYNADQNTLLAFMKSIFQADGHVTVRRREDNVSGQIGFDKISREFCSGVQLLLCRIGIFSRLHARNDSRKDRKTGWRVSIGGLGDARRFAETIGFMSSDKQDLLNQRCLLEGKEASDLVLDSVTEIEDLGVHEVFDIQTESGTYLSNHIVVHNCFIQSVADDLVNDGGIMDLWVREARLFKYGSGTGTNFSNVRGAREKLSGGGTSSGVMSWLRIGDRSAQGIQSGGTTRRAAKMVVLDDNHPEIESFVQWKVEEEQKVAALVAGSKACERIWNQIHVATQNKDFSPKTNKSLKKAIRDGKALGVPEGSIYRAIEMARQELTIHEAFPTYDTNWQGKAYDTVSGQQSNNSISLSNEFLEAVEFGDAWNLTERTTGQICKTLPAEDLWKQICTAAWACADPGLQFRSTMNEWHTCANDEAIRATNPCSEYVFIDDTACNLASIKLTHFQGTDEDFAIDSFEHVVRLITFALEISITMSQLPSPKLARKTHDYRTLGLGIADLGALLMREALPYDSHDARRMGGAIAAILTATSYLASSDLARRLGPFKAYARNRDTMLKVLENHRQATRCGDDKPVYQGLSTLPMELDRNTSSLKIRRMIDEAGTAWDHVMTAGREKGFRNAQASAIAPTGTISIQMDCDTTGPEPDFSLVKYKSLAGGGSMTLVNQSVRPALEKLKYTEEQIDQICAWINGTRKVPPWMDQALADKGFTRDMISKVNRALEHGAPHLLFAVSEICIGRADLLQFTSLSEQDLSSKKTLLEMLGFDEKAINDANLSIVGRSTIEGAPHIKDEHLAIFDCANRCGVLGTRTISAEGHVDMMGALQPFVSGAISKTVNLPREATVDDVERIYLRAHKRMAKAIAIYRDGSKLSQPLESRLKAELFEGLEELEDESAIKPVTVYTTVERLMVRYLSKRRALPFKRRGYTQKAIIGGHKIFLRTGEYPDGSLGEVFLDTHKEGAAFRGLLSAFSMAVSIGLQHGVPLEKLVDLYTFTKYEPNGMVQGDAQIQNCTSMIDWVFRHLAVAYLGREDLAHVKLSQIGSSELAEDIQWSSERDLGVRAAETDHYGIDGIWDDMTEDGTEDGDQERCQEAEPKKLPGEYSTPQTGAQELRTMGSMTPSEVAKAKGYSGDPCGTCGEMKLIRTNGHCTVCENCGENGGCS